MTNFTYKITRRDKCDVLFQLFKVKNIKQNRKCCCHHKHSQYYGYNTNGPFLLHHFQNLPLILNTEYFFHIVAYLIGNSLSLIARVAYCRNINLYLRFCSRRANYYAVAALKGVCIPPIKCRFLRTFFL